MRLYNYYTTFDASIITLPTTIEPDGYNSIAIRNIGVTTAYVNSVIPIYENDPEWLWINPQNVKIVEDLIITFDGGTGQLIVTKYYNNETEAEALAR